MLLATCTGNTTSLLGALVDVGTYQYNTRYTVRLGFYTLYAYVPATPCYSDV